MPRPGPGHHLLRRGAEGVVERGQQGVALLGGLLVILACGRMQDQPAGATAGSAEEPEA